MTADSMVFDLTNRAAISVSVAMFLICTKMICRISPPPDWVNGYWKPIVAIPSPAATPFNKSLHNHSEQLGFCSPDQDHEEVRGVLRNPSCKPERPHLRMREGLPFEEFPKRFQSILPNFQNPQVEAKITPLPESSLIPRATKISQQQWEK